MFVFKGLLNDLKGLYIWKEIDYICVIRSLLLIFDNNFVFRFVCL